MALTIEEIEAIVSGLQAEDDYGVINLSAMKQDLNVFFLLISAYLVFVMQAGFALVCAAQCRAKNTANILLKNILDTSAGAVMYWFIGYGLAYGTCPLDDNGACIEGTKGNAFIGAWDFALHKTFDTGKWHLWIFQWAFAAASTTIAAGAVAERTQFLGYLLYSLIMFGVVYPVVSHWVWDSADTPGWLNNFDTANVPEALNNYGAIDFAGSGVVHLTGGIAGFWGCLLVGPRIGRFDADGKPVPMPGHNLAYMVLGTFILWFGWYGFNPGSTIKLVTYAAASARCAVTTTLSPGAGAVTALLTEYVFSKTLDVTACCNGALGGLVGITAGCAVVMTWGAVVIGSISGCLTVLATRGLLRLKIDDVVGAVPVHAVNGAWGCVAAAFFAHEKNFISIYGDDVYEPGVVYGGPGNLLRSMVVEVFAIIAWVSATIGTLFAILRITGLLRVKAQDELAGLDISKHGGSAYHMEAPVPANYVQLERTK